MLTLTRSVQREAREELPVLPGRAEAVRAAGLGVVQLPVRVTLRHYSVGLLFRVPALSNTFQVLLSSYHSRIHLLMLSLVVLAQLSAR
jgi:hypothetical protein